MPIYQVNQTIDDSSPLIRYSANWAAGQKTDVKWTEYFLGSYMMCSRAGENATFSFVGTAVWLYGALRSNHGLYNVTLDGNTVQRDGFGVDLYKQVLFAATDLTPGPHEVVLTNTRNSSTFANLDLDYIVWQEQLGNDGDVFQDTTVEDDNTAFEYGPISTAWNPDASNDYHGSSGRTTVSATAFVTYTFNGSAATVFGLVGPSQGPYTVSLDGAAATNFTAKANDRHVQQILYHVTNLVDGVHTIRIANAPATTGDALTIDYAVFSKLQPPVVTTTSTTSTETSTSTTTSDTPTSEPTNTQPVNPEKKGLGTGGIVAIVAGTLALLAMLSFALMMYRRRKKSQAEEDEPDMTAAFPQPYTYDNSGFNQGAGRYIPPSQYMQGGYNPLDSSSANPTPLYPPSRAPFDQSQRNTEYFGPGHHVDGASLFSGAAPGLPRSGASVAASRPRMDSGASSGLPYNQSEAASTAAYGAYTAISNGSSRMPEHGHGQGYTDEPPLPPLPPHAAPLSLHTPPPAPPGLIPPRKGQVTLPPSASAEQRQEFQGVDQEELRQRRMNVEGREQDFGPLALDDHLITPAGVPLPPNYAQATESFKR